MEKKPPTHVSCLEHRWPFSPAFHSTRSIGTVKVFQCNSCLSLKIVQQKSGWTVEEPVETVVEMKDSAYPV